MRKKTKLAIIAGALAVAAVCAAVAVIVFNNDNNSSVGTLSKRETEAVSSAAETSSLPEDVSRLIGTWQYKDGTKYIFNSDMTGGMTVDNYTYKYTYKVDGSQLSIDYEKEEVRDAEYTFERIDTGIRLTGGKGTAGGVYEMIPVF